MRAHNPFGGYGLQKLTLSRFCAHGGGLKIEMQTPCMQIHKKGRLKSFQMACGENSNSGTDADRQVGSGRQAVIQDWF